MPSLEKTLLKKQLRQQELFDKTPFQSLNHYEIYTINRYTDTSVMFHLLSIVQQTQYFTIDTESDLFTNRPSLIQIEIINADVSRVLLIETCHLPLDRLSLQFWYIRSLFKCIFRSSNTIFTWSNGKKELNEFISYGLFNHELIDMSKMEDIQQLFKSWFDQSDRIDSLCRPKWGLQSAIVELFDEYLDKNETLNQWSRGLSRRPRNLAEEFKIQSMIQYASNDCLAVTKVAYTIGRLKVKFSRRRKKLDSIISFFFFSSSQIINNNYLIFTFKYCFFSPFNLSIFFQINVLFVFCRSNSFCPLLFSWMNC